MLQLLPQHENRDLSCTWGGHTACCQPCRAPVSAEFSADCRSQSRRNWHNVYYLEGSEIKTKTSHSAFEQVSLEGYRRVDSLLIATGGGYAFYSTVLREYYLWAPRKKKSQISTRKSLLAWVGVSP